MIWLLPLAAFAPLLWRSQGERDLPRFSLAIGAASLIEVWGWLPHYGAPLTAALLILAAQSMRYLRQWNYGGREVGRFLVSAIPVAVLLVMVASEARAIATHGTAAERVQTANVQKENASSKY